ncbi:energy-coupling factor transporter ATPase [Caldinitratiruptor microaerophilus]|uniref:Energy-coupling factor transporter ATP-binding protein EcfA2 n=1 Tax=Caldinitratiruptor microaerophilus TaxID=671077 RepID=A0AA35CN49_9FIRM|nr:energy-coupling factor transporter ATPase [Caldinitratiruptor microaerophilus]BDG62252.1 energy-coupling factor transporter ATP-binding protein EcfA2 [Caldinitratiruptor microaerophilus]
MPVVLDNVSFVYHPGTPHAWRALDGVSLTLDDREAVGVIGPTGSGKSTLVQHIGALLRPTSGRVWIDGVDTSARRADLRAVRRKVGLVFQYPEHQLFAATVREEVAFGPRNLGVPEAEVEERVRWALEAVGLGPELLDRSPFALSGGQARRLALAGVLSMRPQLLVLDEPTAGLDPLGRREMLDLVRRLHEGGMGVVLVSHSMDDVAELVGRVIVLDRGRVVLDGPAREVFHRRQELAALGLDAPAAARLVDLLRERGWPLPGQAVTAAEAAREIAAVLAARGQAAGPRPGR